MTHTPLLTLETIAKYLKAREVQLDMEENNGQRFIRMGWRFEMGDAAVLVSVNDGPSNTSRLGSPASAYRICEGFGAMTWSAVPCRNRTGMGAIWAT